MSVQSAPEIDASDLEAARRAGASELFVMVASMDPVAVEIEYNFVARKLASALDGVGEHDAPAHAERMGARSGDFVTALWDGDLAEALYRADARNSRLLLRTFSKDVLLSALAEDRGSMESARSWLEPNLDRYGWPDTE